MDGKCLEMRLKAPFL